ncbi:DUF4229 domain-containing protein [Sinomonas albida]|uniref:DUF4229 domain-containing protein n=1 Tax=Sinomonas albida TaxID=369942 RepID=UPI001F44F0A3|nr:DUF4229 domain-containing protein [Sinomonas albida]
MAFLKYTLLRAALFVVPFVVFLLLGIGGVLSAVYAAVIAFAVSFLFLNRQRNAAAGDVRDVFGGRKEVRTSQEKEDAEIEDSFDEARRADDEYPEVYRDDEATAPEEAHKAEFGKGQPGGNQAKGA